MNKGQFRHVLWQNDMLRNLPSSEMRQLATHCISTIKYVGIENDTSTEPIGISRSSATFLNLVYLTHFDVVLHMSLGNTNFSAACLGCGTSLYAQPAAW